MIYETINPAVLQNAPAQMKRALDIGCGSGLMGQTLKNKYACHVTGITFDPAEANIASTRLDEVHVADLNTYSVAQLGQFDFILCSHVLEHLYAPDKFLRALLPQLTTGGTVLVALPNVMYWKQRLKFLRGRFRYTAGGIMDETHFRFFDWWSAREMVTSAGFKIERASAYGNLPFSYLFGSGGRERLNARATRYYPNFFGTQFVIVARA